MGVDAEFKARLDALVSGTVAGCTGLDAVKRLSGGASQETYRLDLAGDASPATLALRRAAHITVSADEKLGPRVEAQLFDAAQAAGVPVPAVRYVLAPEDGLGEGFLMDWLSGETLGGRIVHHDAFARIRPSLARNCGALLGRIHNIDVATTGLDQVLPRATPAQLVMRTWEAYRNLDMAQPMIDFTARWLLDNLPDEAPLALTHGDFRNGNLMVDGEAGIIAVLDWELAHLGDPVRDLGWICTNSWRFGVADQPVGGFGTREDLLAGYAAETGREIAPAHLMFWEVFGSFWWAAMTLVMGASYAQGLDSSVERPAIGRRSSECQVDCTNLLIPGPLVALAAAPANTVGGVSTADVLDSVQDFLRADVLASTTGRTKFLTRVAANAVAIARRELSLGPARDAYMAEALADMFGESMPLSELIWRLTEGLRNGSIALDTPGLEAFLRHSVVMQLHIDQPNYWGLETAERFAAEKA